MPLWGKYGMVILMYPWCEEEIQVLMQQNLVLRVSSAEILQECMCQGHDLPHLLITLCKGRNKQIKRETIRNNVKHKHKKINKCKVSFHWLSLL